MWGPCLEKGKIELIWLVQNWHWFDQWTIFFCKRTVQYHLEKKIVLYFLVVTAPISDYLFKGRCLVVELWPYRKLLLVTSGPEPVFPSVTLFIMLWSDMERWTQITLYHFNTFLFFWYILNLFRQYEIPLCSKKNNNWWN